MSVNKRGLTRRDFLKLAAASTSVGVLAACVQPAAPGAQAPAAGQQAAPAAAKPHLIFTGWNAVEWYQPVAEEFMKENPDVQVEYRQLSDYKQQITLFAAGEQ